MFSKRVTQLDVYSNRLSDRSGHIEATLQKLIDAARGRTMSAAEQEVQRRSFAYGDAHIENERVTREMVDEAADKAEARALTLQR